MNRDKHQRITDLFLEVCDLDVELQESTLASLCGKDIELIKLQLDLDQITNH